MSAARHAGRTDFATQAAKFMAAPRAGPDPTLCCRSMKDFLSRVRHSGIVTMALAALLLGSPLPGMANDSTGRVGSSGLELEKSGSIEMREEILAIGVDRISVRYRFYNASDADIETVVAFPMPAFGWNPGMAQWDANVGPLRGFRTMVDGVEKPAQVDVKAWMGGRDITSNLLSAGLGSADIVSRLQCPADKVGSTCWGTLKPTLLARDLITPQGWPKWEAQETAYWTMVFPAHKEVRVEHAYTPLVGASYQVQSGSEPLLAGHPWASFGNRDTKEGCVDASTVRQVDALRRRLADENGVMLRDKVVDDAARGAFWLTLRDVEYVLGTGRNWKGPIQRFVLRIEKKTPQQVVSLCFPSKPRRVDERTVEYEAKNFVPQDSLVVYFYDLAWEH
jgi:hypothetical protein